jgi:RIP metalloprotease RseP
VSETIPPGTPVPPDDDRPGEDVEVREREPKWFDRITDPLARAGESPVLRAAIVVVALAYAAFVSIWVFVGIMALVVSVFLHELGHFLVAKRNGMKVTEFFLGFGPRIWSFRRGETVYGLKVLPLGAYVKIIGMSNLEEVAPEDEARSYRAKSYWQRMPVVLAGPAVNIALGVLLLFVVYASFGYTVGGRQVATVTPGSAAAAAGLLPGDEIVAVNGTTIAEFGDISSELQSVGSQQIDVTVERDGVEQVVPVDLGWGLDEDVSRQLGLQRGDRITRVGDTSVSSYDEVVAALATAPDPVVLRADGTYGEKVVTVRGPLELPVNGSVGMLGVVRADGGERTVHVNPVEAAGRSVSEVGELITSAVGAFPKVFSPSGLANLASMVANGSDDEQSTVVVEPARYVDVPQGVPAADAGPGTQLNEERPSSIIGIVDLLTQIGEEAGWAGVLAILAMVNVILGLINLVPLLPFDGGHIAVATYEAIRGRVAHRQYRVDMARLMPVTYIVLVIVLGVFLSSAFLDIVDPVKIK